MGNFKQRQIEYLTKIKNNPDIINKLIIDKNSEKGQRTIRVLLDPKDEKELFVAESLFSMTANLLVLFDKIRNGEIEEIQNTENSALQLYIEIIDALKNEEKEYAECLVQSISPKDAARMMYETIISFAGYNSHNCVAYVANESGFDLRDEDEMINFYSYFEQAKELMNKNGSMSKDLDDCTTEDFEQASELVNEFSRLCQKESYCATK